jgi:hypothetical protein
MIRGSPFDSGFRDPETGDTLPRACTGLREEYPLVHPIMSSGSSVAVPVVVVVWWWCESESVTKSGPDPSLAEECHAPTIALDPGERFLLCSARPRHPPRCPRLPRGTTALAFLRYRTRPCRMLAGQNTVRSSVPRRSDRVVSLSLLTTGCSVLAQVDAKMVRPEPQRSFEGLISIHCELSPMASTEYEPGRYVSDSPLFVPD